VIPCHNEYPGVFAVLASLAASAEYASGGDRAAGTVGTVGTGMFYAICVVNNRESDSGEVKENNLQLLKLLEGKTEKNLQVIGIDCASPGRCLPEGQGVGLARKIGMDYALSLFADMRGSSRGTELTASGVISCLDADTTVSRDYCSALVRFGTEGRHGGAALSFAHRQDGEEREAKIAREYESWLLEHSRRLRLAGSPYYPTALGSAIACTIPAYIAAGGMNCRLAGEDFYFLQSLIKTGSVAPLVAAGGDALVFPSSRISSRVPFGTGPKIDAVLRGAEMIQPFREESYRILRCWLALVQSSVPRMVNTGDPEKETLLEEAQGISGYLYRFLEAERFSPVWEKLFRNNKTSSERLLHAFHCWFDGLKTIRLFHYLEEKNEP
jgi:hypothetical protein